MKTKKIIKMVVKKVIYLIVSLFVLSVITFTMARLAPGDPLESYYGSRVERMSTAERNITIERLGLNDSYSVQYARWFKGAVVGDFGISYKYKQPVSEVVGERAFNTFILGAGAIAIVFVEALLLGAYCAYKEGTLTDKIICSIGVVSSCMMEFFLALIVILIFSVNLHWFPSSGAFTIGGSGTFTSRLYHLVLPMSVAVVGHIWYYAYMVRNKLLDELNKEYVLLAYLKGLSKKECILKHCIKNIMPTYLAIMAVSVPHIIGGTYIIEKVFSYPGIGTLAFESAKYHDYNMLMVIVLLTGLIVFLASIVTDIIIKIIDPRMAEDLQEEVDGGCCYD